jgi:uncharacterized protein (DUF1778 family)
MPSAVGPTLVEVDVEAAQDAWEIENDLLDPAAMATVANDLGMRSSHTAHEMTAACLARVDDLMFRSGASAVAAIAEQKGPDIQCVSPSQSNFKPRCAMPVSSSTANTEPTTRAVDLRVRDEIRDLIDQAARIQGRSHSDFVIDAARRAAEETLLDQTLVRVDRETYERFVAVLDHPPDGEGYERLMAAPSPWKA